MTWPRACCFWPKTRGSKSRFDKWTGLFFHTSLMGDEGVKNFQLVVNNWIFMYVLYNLYKDTLKIERSSSSSFWIHFLNNIMPFYLQAIFSLKIGTYTKCEVSYALQKLSLAQRGLHGFQFCMVSDRSEHTLCEINTTTK